MNLSTSIYKRDTSVAKLVSAWLSEQVAFCLIPVALDIYPFSVALSTSHKTEHWRREGKEPTVGFPGRPAYFS